MGATTHLQKLSSTARAHLDELLDEALEETFPASDPIAFPVELEMMESESQGIEDRKRGTYAKSADNFTQPPKPQA
jgi:hypothetical protein